MFTIRKEFHFSASHQLTHLPPEHPSARLHGHNYVVEFELQADRTDPETGFVQDYRALDAVKTWLDDRFDHRHLNDVLGDSRATTAEHLAVAIFTAWRAHYPSLVAVRVCETAKTWAEFRVPRHREPTG
jgi:6-pyruvoyltetrahydropterin/6-carboxytetrahydropterin synthase